MMMMMMMMIERGSREKKRDCVCATPVAARALTRNTRAIILKHILYSPTCFIITLIRKDFPFPYVLLSCKQFYL